MARLASRSRLVREVDEAVVLPVARERRGALEIALLVGYVARQPDVALVAVVEPQHVLVLARARRELRADNRQRLVAALVDERCSGALEALSDRGKDGLRHDLALLLARAGARAGAGTGSGGLALVVVAAAEDLDPAEDQQRQDHDGTQTAEDPPAHERRLRLGGERAAAAAPRRAGRGARRCRIAVRCDGALAAPRPRPCLADGDLWSLAVSVEVVERVEQRVRPDARRLGALQVAASRLRLRSCLLPKDVIGKLAAPLGVDELGRVRSESGQRLTRQLAHAGGRKIEHLPDLLVALVLPQDDLDDRPLVGRELVKRGHRTMKGTF